MPVAKTKVVEPSPWRSEVIGRFQAGLQADASAPVEVVRQVWPRELKQIEARRRQRLAAIDRIRLLMLRHGIKAKDLGQLFQ